MAASPEDRVDLMRRGFEAYNAADTEALLEIFDPSVEVYAPPELMNAGTFHGHQGLADWLSSWNEAWESFVIQVRSIEAVGDRHVIAQADQTGRGRGSGAEVTLSVTYVLEERDGRGVFFAIYPQRGTALAVARERESADLA
jgi:ketosteroid isomerase-like protein